MNPAPASFWGGLLPSRSPSRSRYALAVALGLAILLHLLLLSGPADWWVPKQAPRVEVQSLTPEQLERLRQQWKQRPLLLSKDATPKTQQPEPKDARFDSDRNRTAEKETRARVSENIPQAATSKQAQPTGAVLPKAHLPSLGQLGVPLGLTAKPPTLAQAANQEDRPAAEQWIDDPSLDQGDQNVLNTRESVYYSFYARIQQKLAPIWESAARQAAAGLRIPGGEYTTLAETDLDAEGYVRETRILKTCGIPSLDAAIPKAWKLAARFPNPPKDLLVNGRVTIRYTYQFTTNASFWQYATPRRVAE